ncbi:MAG: hypothetical protein ACREH6_00705, partial [Geminicoccaceae bacterium]
MTAPEERNPRHGVFVSDPPMKGRVERRGERMVASVGIRMKSVLRVALSALLLVIIWAALIIFGTSEGWWRQTLAPRGDTARFMDAARQLVNAGNGGNTVFALIDVGSVYGV